MRNAIIEKLNKHMGKCPATESDVVYALVQIRKLLEQSDEKGSYCWLNLFCNWVVHPKLDKGKAVDGILEVLEEGLTRTSVFDASTFDRDGKAGEVLSFDLFRAELVEFCSANELTTLWVNECWRQFLALYAEVVKDCPLIIRQLEADKKLRKVVLTASDSSHRYIDEPYRGKVVLHFDWELTLDDGQNRTFGYNLVLSAE
jgi:hypothetical protein